MLAHEFISGFVGIPVLFGDTCLFSSLNYELKTELISTMALSQRVVIKSKEILKMAI